MKTTTRTLLGMLLTAVPAAALPAAGAQDAANTSDVQAFVARTVADNPELDFYEAELEAAEAGLRVAGARSDPELGLEFGRKRVSAAGGGLADEGTTWAVSVSQTFEWPGRLTLRKAIANRDIALAQLGLERFRAALAARAQVLAFGLHAARARAGAADEVAARYQALREMFLAREPGGITPLLETRVIEAQELTIQRAAMEARLAVHAALLELNQLRGAPAGAEVEFAPIRLEFAAAPAMEALLAAAERNNFEFRAAQIELEQQGFEVSLARHETRPGITVSPYFSEERAGEKEQSFGIGLSLPLPVGGGRGAGVAEAQARRRQAEVVLMLARRAMERDVSTAAQTYAASLEAMSQWSTDPALKFREAAALADRHFRLGAVPIGTYVELQNAYLEAMEALYQTEHEALEAATELQLLTGFDTPLVVAQSRE